MANWKILRKSKPQIYLEESENVWNDEFIMYKLPWDMSKAERDDIRIEFTDASREIHGVMSIVCHKIWLWLCINSQTTQNEIHGLEVQRMWSLQNKRNDSYICYGTV